MKIEDVNWKTNVLFVFIIIFFLVFLFSGYMTSTHLQEQIDENRCIMGGACPEINSILADRISEVLDRDGLELSCKEYEQIQIIAVNITCKSCGHWFNTPEYECRFFSEISEDLNIECDYKREMISKETIITTKKGECLRYEIVKK